MPHIHIKHFAPSLPEDTVHQLSASLVETVVRFLGSEEGAISIAVQAVPPEQWDAHVYEPDIAGKRQWLVKAPGYGRLKGEAA